jgi:hypothetical protein
MKKAHLHVRIDSALRERLDKYNAACAGNLGALVERALKAYLPKIPTRQSAPSPLRRAGSAGSTDRQPAPSPQEAK